MDLSIVPDNPTRTFTISSKNPAIDGLEVTVRPNDGALLRLVSRELKARNIATGVLGQSDEDIYEKLLVTAASAVVSCKNAAGETVEKKELRKLFEKYDALAREVRRQSQVLQDELEGEITSSEKN